MSNRLREFCSIQVIDDARVMPGLSIGIADGVNNDGVACSNCGACGGGGCDCGRGVVVSGGGGRGAMAVIVTTLELLSKPMSECSGDSMMLSRAALRSVLSECPVTGSLVLRGSIGPLMTLRLSLPFASMSLAGCCAFLCSILVWLQSMCPAADCGTGGVGIILL